jgi:membrane protein YdbS with pleckstrin-like domain
MRLVRIAMSVFVLLLISVSVAGWVWTGGHQAPAQATASRIVLTLGVTGGLVGLHAIWKNRAEK